MEHCIVWYSVDYTEQIITCRYKRPPDTCSYYVQQIDSSWTTSNWCFSWTINFLKRICSYTVFVQENILAAKLLSHDECLYLPNIVWTSANYGLNACLGTYQPIMMQVANSYRQCGNYCKFSQFSVMQSLLAKCGLTPNQKLCVCHLSCLDLL